MRQRTFHDIRQESKNDPPRPPLNIPPHPLGAKLGPSGIKERRQAPLLAGEIVRLLERHGVPWEQAVREAAGLMAQTVEETEGWWAFETNDGDLLDTELIAAKLAASPLPEEPPELKEALDELEKAVVALCINGESARSNIGWKDDERWNAARAALVALFGTDSKHLTEAWASCERLESRVASLSSQLELARDSASEYEAERNEAGTRARAAESSLERLKAEQLTAEEARYCIEVVSATHTTKELGGNKELLEKLRRLSQSDTGDTNG